MVHATLYPESGDATLFQHDGIIIDGIRYKTVLDVSQVPLSCRYNPTNGRNHN